EDRRFYDHSGIDRRGFVRASVRNIMALGVRDGISTITMHVARNTFFVDRIHYSNRTFEKNPLESLITGIMEPTLTKERIFELYLNAVYLGNGTYGVEATSRDLFGRSVEHVTPDEGAMLAALPKGPSSYTPRRSAERALSRRNLVLTLMEQEGHLTTEDADKYRAEPLDIEEPDRTRSRYGNSFALDAVRTFVDSVLDGNVARLPDLVVYTTL